MGDASDLKPYREALKIPVSEGNRVFYYIGGTDTFKAMRAAIEEATREDASAFFVYMLGWHLEIDTPMSGEKGSATFEEVIRDASDRGVQIRAMLWNNPLTPNTSAVTFLMGLKNGAAIQDDSAPSEPVGSHHQKVVLVRGKNGLVAFCGGLDISKDRVMEVFRPRGSPLHDIHCEIRGPAANKFLKLFVDRWQAHLQRSRIEYDKGPLRVSAVESGDSATPSAPAKGEQLVAIATTMNQFLRRSSDAIAGTTDEYCALSRTVATSISALIGAAKHFIYLEEQYLTNLKLAELINKKLPDLQHVTILLTQDEISDLSGVDRARVAFMQKAVQGLKPEDSSKLRIFSRLYGGASSPKYQIKYRYIHSKLLIIDDLVAIIGSANATSRSWWLDSEASAIIMDDPSLQGGAFAKRLRSQVWAGHLGVDIKGVWSADTLSVVKGWWDDEQRKNNFVRKYQPGRNPSLGKYEFFLDPQKDIFPACRQK
jgi:phosphatidylserine/phosphatidylglycerophosphate/cardiolipin synthase-like enzyme